MKMSKEQKEFLKRYKREKIFITFIQISIIVVFFSIWEYLSSNNIINAFIFSSPSNIVRTIVELYSTNNLFNHIFVTIYETLVAFGIGLIISIFLSILLYLYTNLNKILDPFLTCLNSLPKVALGPMIIIIFGATIKSIIVMAILINVIVSTVVITNGFYNTDKIKLKLLNSFKASKYQILKYLVIPSSYKTIISSFKLGISMSLIGVITGEFLVSKAGLGYLIIYGTQVFNLDLVVTGIFLLVVISFLLYKIIEIIEKLLLNL